MHDRTNRKHNVFIPVTSRVQRLNVKLSCSVESIRNAHGLQSSHSRPPPQRQPIETSGLNADGLLKLDVLLFLCLLLYERVLGRVVISVLD